MTFSREIRHDGLKRSRIVQGPSPHHVQRQARAQLEAWESVWASLAEGGRLGDGEGWRPDLDQAPTSPDEGHRIAATLTEAAQCALKELGEIFPESVSPARASQAQLELFSEPPPQQPDLPDPKPRPVRTEPRFQPALGLLDRLFPKRRRILEKEADARFQAAWTAWYQQENEVRETLGAHQARFEEWDRRRLDFEEQQRRWVRERKKEGMDLEDPKAIAEHFSEVLSSTRLPACLPKEARISYDGQNGILAVDYRLPALEDLPSLARVSYREDQGDFLEEHLSEADRLEVYDSVVYQCALRTVKEIFSAERVQGMRAVTFNGWADALDPGTGRREKVYIAALEAERTRFAEIIPERVSLEACFMAMGGVSAGKPHQLLAIVPIAAHAEREGGPLETRVETPGAGHLDLQILPTQEFHRLLLRVLDQTFVPEGGDLQVTVAREDGGMEAIGCHTGSEGRRATVFHVARSPSPADERAIQNLLDRMAREGADRGVFLTTGGFTSGAIELAQSKPVSLIGGRALEGLLKPGLEPERTSGEPWDVGDAPRLRPQ